MITAPPDAITSDLVDVAGMAIVESLAVLAQHAFEWNETRATLNDAIEAASFIACRAHGIFSHEYEAGMDSEGEDALRRVVKNWAHWCLIMAEQDALDQKAPASQAWWIDQSEKVGRVVDAVGWS